MKFETSAGVSQLVSPRSSAMASPLRLSRHPHQLMTRILYSDRSRDRPQGPLSNGEQGAHQYAIDDSSGPNPSITQLWAPTAAPKPS